MRRYTETITDKTAWTRDSLLGSNDWTIRVDETQKRELESALLNWRRQGGLYHQANPESFPLPNWQGVVASVKRGLFDRGLVLIKGFPVETKSETDCNDMYWGLSTHLGIAVTQNNKGGLMIPVYDRAFRGETAEKQFGYSSNKELEFHIDMTDIFGLMCIHQAKYGGETRLASAITIHNEMLRARPDLLEALYDGFVWMRRYPGGGSFSEPIPAFAYSNGKVLTRFHRRYIDTGADVSGIPLTPLQREALDYFESLLERPELVAEFRLEPGDVIYINNYSVLHAKKPHRDEGDRDKGRLLQRLWLYMREFDGYDLTMRQGPGRYGVVGLTSAEWWARQEASRQWSSVGLPIPEAATTFTEDWPELKFASAG